MSHSAGTPEYEDVAPGGTVRNRIPATLPVLLLLFSLVIFGNTLDQYISMDDFDVIYSARNNKLSHVLLGYDTVLEHRFFRPVPMFSYWLQTRLFGVEPTMFHLTSLLLHVCCATLAMNLFYLLFRDLRTAALFGFVFVAFPGHEEVIHSPAINFTSWATLFYLATLNIFGYYRLSSKSYLFLLSVLSFVAAILSKEMAFTLPASLMVFDYFFSRSRGIKPTIFNRVVNHGVYVVLLVLALFLIRGYLKTGYGYATAEGKDIISSYLSNIGLLLGDFLKMSLDVWKYLLAPLSTDIPFRKGLMFLTLTCVIFSGAVLALKRRMNMTALVYCAVFVTVTSLPILAVYDVLGLLHGTRVLYLPSVASCYIVSMILSGMLSGVAGPKARYALVIILMLPMVILTKFHHIKWVKMHEENENFMEEIVRTCSQFPEYTRFYVSDAPTHVHYGLPSAVGLFCEKKNVEGALDFLPPIKVLSLEREDYAERDWRYFWLEWSKETGTLIMKRSIQPKTSSEASVSTWDFAEIRNQEALEPAKDISRMLMPNSAYPVFLVEDGWALLKLPVLPNRLPVKYLSLDMMLTGEGGSTNVSRIFWITEKDLTYGGGRSIGFNSLRDGKFHEYRIPLYRHGRSLIDPQTLRFAVRPSQDAGTVFVIRKMTVEYY